MILYIKVLLLHFLGALIYYTTTSLMFVKGHHANPIGIGILQYLFWFLHFITAIVLGFGRPAHSGWKHATAHLVGMLLPGILYLAFNYHIWNWLWQLRG